MIRGDEELPLFLARRDDIGLSPQPRHLAGERIIALFKPSGRRLKPWPPPDRASVDIGRLNRFQLLGHHGEGQRAKPAPRAASRRELIADGGAA